LAYDGTDDTFWLLPAASPADLYHVDLTGRPLGQSRLVLGVPEPDSGRGCDTFGLAAGGGGLFVSADGCTQLYRTLRTDPTRSSLVATVGTTLGDLECDDLTFAGAGQGAIWSNPSDGVLTAFALDAGDCGYGGLPPAGLGGPVVLTGIDAEDCGP